ncbi:MAG: hypothetical protein Q4G03_04140 [Planctomycetia bacterium]|nr:hypothetical protein [Planctomycetia bacterium]
MKFHLLRASACLLLIALMCVGCGKAKKPAGMPDLFPTTITVTLDGKGLEDATVTLIPGEKSSYIPSGVTDKSGKVEIKTSGQFKGAPAGDYKIIVSAPEQIDYGEAGPPPTDPDALEKWNRSVDPTKFKRFSPIEVKYTDPSQTPLTITIASGKNEQTFDLGAAVSDEVKYDDK